MKSPAAPNPPAPVRDDLPGWAAKEEVMESPTSCLEDQLLLPGVMPPVMAECPACMAENRMECHDCEREETPRTDSPLPHHSCGFSPMTARPPPPSNGLPRPRTRQESPPRSLRLRNGPDPPAGAPPDPLAEIEQLRLQSPPGVTTPVHRATSATGPGPSPGNRRKSVRELYGQPSWWGEDDGDVYSYPHTASLAGQERPDPGKPPRSRQTPRDSLESSRPTTAETKVSSHPPVTPTRPAEAFTVVFEDTGGGDEDSVPGVEEGADTPPPAGQPLSQFVPSKIRKSFQERQQERQQGVKRRQRPPEKGRADAAPASRPTTAPGSRTARPAPAPSRQPARGSRPATAAAARPDLSASPGERTAKKPPIHKQRSQPPAPASKDPPSKRTAGQSSTGSSRVVSGKSSTPSATPKRITMMRKSESTDKLKHSSGVSIDTLKSYGDTKSYLFDRMFDGAAVSPVPAPKQTTSPPLRPHNSTVTRASPALTSPAAISTGAGDGRCGGSRQDGSDAGTYTIDKETKEYEEARRTDLSAGLGSRGCADGGEREDGLAQKVEAAAAAAAAAEEEERMTEPLSVCEMDGGDVSDGETEQEPCSIHFGISAPPI